MTDSEQITSSIPVIITAYAVKKNTDSLFNKKKAQRQSIFEHSKSMSILRRK